MKRVIKTILLLFIIAGIGISLYILDSYGALPKRYYGNSDFGIGAYKSENDTDGDGIDDQTDILKSAREYVSKKPKYKSKYYNGGFPDDGYGVCTDVVDFALLNSGYNMMELVNKDIISAKSEYNVSKPDKNIDFRRVPNLQVYFERHAESLTTDIKKTDQWQGGDIVVFPHHIAIVSDRRNKKGIPYIIHNAGQPFYEVDAIERYTVVAHFRL